jgi:hypothetical protein
LSHGKIHILIRDARSKPATLANELVVVADAGNGLFHVKYSNERICNTRMVIKDADGNRIFTELIRNQCSFIRPYNFLQLPYGRYTIIATNAYGEKTTSVDHQPEPEPVIPYNIIKRKDGKYLLQIPKTSFTRLKIEITKDEQFLYSKVVKPEGDFACLYTIKSMADIDSVTFRITVKQ